MKRQHPIEVQESSTAADGRGGQVVGWTTLFTWWAEVSGVRGREEERLGRLVTAETYVLAGRYEPRISTHHRLVWDGKALNIRNVQDREGTRTKTTLEAEAGVAP